METPVKGGAGVGYGTAILITVTLTGLFTYILVSADIEGIKNDWSNRRCELPVMIMAGMLKPQNSSQSSLDFAKDNFAFCTRKIIQTTLKTMFAPFYAILGQQVNVLGTMSGPMNSLRGALGNSMRIFEKFLDKLYRKFQLINASVLQTWGHLLFAMGRIQAIAYSIVYFGLSINVLIQNTIDFMYKAIAIFLGIMVALIILLFFVLFPFIPLILSVVTVLAAAGVAGVAGMEGAFCVDPSARIRLASGKWKALYNIKIGDQLYSGTSEKNIVTGIMDVDASDISLVSIHNIKMSGSHRILHNDSWILAKDHPEAKDAETKLPRLVCLNTSLHSVPIITHKGLLFAGDWEEVSDDAGRRAWIEMTNLILNGGHISMRKYPTAVPLVSPNVKVNEEQRGNVPIHSIEIGDSVLSKDGAYTRVKGVYHGIVNVNELPKDPEWISDGVWVFREPRFWSTHTGISHMEDGEHILQGIFLITEDETFSLLDGIQWKLVRDFTEVGASRIDKTYEVLDSFL